MQLSPIQYQIERTPWEFTLQHFEFLDRDCRLEFS